MEDHIPNWFQNNWLNNEELHNLLNINIKPNYNSSRPLTKVVAGDTDSIYLSYEGLLDSIEGSESMSIEQKRDILVNLNLKFLDAHNNEFMTNYYNKRHAKSVHNFELETICMSECRLNVKKRYAQLLLWKDGKIYDVDKLPMKTKGLEMIKSSYPKQARESLKELVRFLLEDKSNEFLLQRLNIEMQKQREVFNNADIEDVCGNVKVQNYTNYILDDNNALGVQVAPKCPYNAKALGNYNNIRNVNNLPGDPIYGGKVKWYYYRPNGIKSQRKEPDYFAFQSRKYPKWAAKYAPIDREAMFEKTVLAPFNRILNAANIGELKRDGSMQMELFF
jgi:DNA polymerase elongation subunit (family B)